MGQASFARSKTKVELDSHADRCVIGDNSFITNDHNRPVIVFGYDSKDGHKYARTLNAAVFYNNPHSGQNHFLIINQTNQISNFANHLLCPMQCHINGVQISEVTKHLTDSPSDYLYYTVIQTSLCLPPNYKKISLADQEICVWGTPVTQTSTAGW